MSRSTGLLMLSWLLVSVQSGSTTAATPAILDTDIGSWVDDAFALGLVLASPELDLQGVTTVGEDAEDRAWMVCRFLTELKRTNVPVAYGRAPQPESEIDWQIQYRRHPAVVWNRTVKPSKESAVEFLRQHLSRADDKVTLIATGPLTNFARLLKEYPDCKSQIERIVLMGCSIDVGYTGKRPQVAEWNIRSDVKAAQTVFTSGVPLVVASLDAAVALKLDEARRQRLFAKCSPLTFQIQSLYELWGEETPTLFDPLAVALASNEQFCSMEEMRLDISDRGLIRKIPGTPNARVALATEKEKFLDWYVTRVTSEGETRLPKAAGNLSQLIARKGLPTRVHTFENYNTDIEKRWWMTGKLETKDVPLGGRRACRAVLTQDFDGKMGDTETMYRAVVFNPVPGPPMGPRTRLSFRYKLLGTDTIRVQLYSLSNGYHRYLSISDLKQNEWTSATVDMTAMRRPDGSGGPLAADERIDDIQFYIDPRAELLIDDVVLYDEAPEGQQRPFPKRFLFTGWFDTGKQGREWPGTFDIVLHDKPRTWDAARSVLNAEAKSSWIRIHMRGRRRLAELVRLRFEYHLSKGDSLQIALVDSKTKKRYPLKATGLMSKTWSEFTLDFPIDAVDRERFVDEIHLFGKNDAEFRIDNLLLYVPGK